MIDVMTKKPIRVWAEETEWPWMVIPVSQLDDVKRLLDEHDVEYTVGEHYLSVNEGPFDAFIRLKRGTDGKAVQAILDVACDRKEKLMIDVLSNQPLRVLTDYPPRPSIEVALNQVEEIQRLLDRHGFRYEVLEDALSMDEGPFTTEIIFASGTDAKAVQTVLDSVS